MTFISYIHGELIRKLFIARVQCFIRNLFRTHRRERAYAYLHDTQNAYARVRGNMYCVYCEENWAAPIAFRYNTGDMAINYTTLSQAMRDEWSPVKFENCENFRQK